MYALCTFSLSTQGNGHIRVVGFTTQGTKQLVFDAQFYLRVFPEHKSLGQISNSSATEGLSAGATLTDNAKLANHGLAYPQLCMSLELSCMVHHVMCSRYRYRTQCHALALNLSSSCHGWSLCQIADLYFQPAIDDSQISA